MMILYSTLTCFHVLFWQEDPTLERNFKGHRDTITSLDFNPNMKQLGESLAQLYFNNM